MQEKDVLNVNSLNIIWSIFFYFQLWTSFLENLFYKIFILLVLALVYYLFLQVTRGNFTGK